MSVLNYYIEKLKNGVITFINMVSLANRDLPYHDYHKFEYESTELSYKVGTNQVNLRGDQKKFFISKSTLIYATEEISIIFNDSRNVIITILANTWYEFKSNIRSIQLYSALSSGKYMYCYFEGVLPEEQRRPE